MIKLFPGYDRMPKFGGFGRYGAMDPNMAHISDPTGQISADLHNTAMKVLAANPEMALTLGPRTFATVAPPAAPVASNADLWLQRGIVYGGVPMCGAVFLKKGGTVGLVAALIGVGIAGMFVTGGFTQIGPSSP